MHKRPFFVRNCSGEENTATIGDNTLNSEFLKKHSQGTDLLALAVKKGVISSLALYVTKND